MMRSAYSLFTASPPWVQDIAISCYGLQVRHRRYGGQFQTDYANLIRQDFASSSCLADYQNQQLQRIVSHAVSNLEVYRQRLGTTREALARLTAVDLPSAFPCLPKATVRLAPNDFTVRKYSSGLVTQTSGSTGSPLIVPVTKGAIRRNYSFFARFLNWHGVSPFDKSATFAGRLFVSDGRPVSRKYRRNWALHDTLYSSYHLSPADIESYVHDLRKWQPKYIDSYPSAINQLSSYIINQNLEGAIRPRVIVTSSETLTVTQRITIERAFCSKVRDQFGSAEMVGFLAECEHGRYHVATEYGVVELVDDDGNPVPAGTRGNLCLTGFLNPAMPLIRYLIGDTAIGSRNRCSCGRSSQVIESIEGRVDDVIVTPSGRRIGRLDPAFKGVEGVAEAQVVQVQLDRIVVKVVLCARGLFDEKSLIQNLRDRVGVDVNIDLEIVARIDREANGKFRAVRSLLHASEGGFR